MKRAWVALAVLFLLLAGTVCASAVELTAGTICAYDKNILTVASEDDGRLTIEAWNGTLPLENIVTDLKTEPGTVEIPWDGLSWGGDPVPAGQIRLRATLACSDRTVEQTEITAAADTPLTAVVCCLPAARRYYPDGKNPLRIEVALSAAGAWEISAAPKDRPEETVWHDSGRSEDRKSVV